MWGWTWHSEPLLVSACHHLLFTTLCMNLATAPVWDLIILNIMTTHPAHHGCFFRCTSFKVRMVYALVELTVVALFSTRIHFMHGGRQRGLLQDLSRSHETMNDRLLNQLCSYVQHNHIVSFSFLSLSSALLASVVVQKAQWDLYFPFSHTNSVHISPLLIPLPEESSQQQSIRNRHLRRPLLPSKATTHKPNGVL